MVTELGALHFVQCLIPNLKLSSEYRSGKVSTSTSPAAVLLVDGLFAPVSPMIVTIVGVHIFIAAYTKFTKKSEEKMKGRKKTRGTVKEKRVIKDKYNEISVKNNNRGVEIKKNENDSIQKYEQ